MSKDFERFVTSWLETFQHLPANTLNWCSIIVGQCVFLPTLIAIFTGMSDHTPTVDIVLFVLGLCLLSFFRAVVARDMVGIVLHSLGWFVQVTLFSLILFK